MAITVPNIGATFCAPTGIFFQVSFFLTPKIPSWNGILGAPGLANTLNPYQMVFFVWTY